MQHKNKGGKEHNEVPINEILNNFDHLIGTLE